MGAYDYGQVVQLPNQEQRSVYTLVQSPLGAERYPLGTLGTTQDGRWFQFSKNGASTLVAGNVLTGPVNDSNFINNTAAATAVGATSTVFTQGATAITQNLFKDGWLSVSVTPGAGYLYGLAEHGAVGSATSATWTLANGETFQVALTTTSRLDLVRNPHRGVIQCPATTIAACPVGVAVSVPLLNQYCWVQVQGAANVLTAGTLIIGNRAITPTGTAGACGPESATTAVFNIDCDLGRVISVAASTAWSVINLEMLGS